MKIQYLSWEDRNHSVLPGSLPPTYQQGPKLLNLNMRSIKQEQCILSWAGRVISPKVDENFLEYLREVIYPINNESSLKKLPLWSDPLCRSFRRGKYEDVGFELTSLNLTVTDIMDSDGLMFSKTDLNTMRRFDEFVLVRKLILLLRIVDRRVGRVRVLLKYVPATARPVARLEVEGRVVHPQPQRARDVYRQPRAGPAARLRQHSEPKQNGIRQLSRRVNSR
jgi:hypothetical protein